MRELRLKQLKAKQEEDEKAAAASAAAAKKAAEERKSNGQLVAAAAKQGIRAAKDLIKNLRHANNTAMDPEEHRMAERYKRKAKEGEGDQVAAIKDIRITWGEDETREFQTQNDHFCERGFPYFEK